MPYSPNYLYFIVRCYIIVHLNGPDGPDGPIQTSFKTFGVEYIHALQQVYEQMGARGKLEFELIRIYEQVWCLARIARREHVNVRAVAQQMGLRFKEGLHPFFSCLPGALDAFPVPLEAVAQQSVYHVDGEFKTLLEMPRK